MRVTSVTMGSAQGRIRRLLRGLASGFRPSARSSVADWPGDAEPSPKPAGQLDRRTFLLAGTASAVLFGGATLNAQLGDRSQKLHASALDPAVTGQWTAPFNLGLVSIHAVLLHTGQVLLFSWPNNTVGSAAQALLPHASASPWRQLCHGDAQPLHRRQHAGALRARHA